MNKTFIIVILAFLLITCGSPGRKNQEGQQPVITVSILPIKTFVEKIAGEDFEVNVLLPQGASPANFSLIPSQLKKITESGLWFRIGYIGFEMSWQEKIREVNPNMKVINLSEGLDLIDSEKQFEEEPDRAAGINPHTWLSSSLVRQMAGRIRTELSELNPGKKEFYEENYKRFMEEIDDLDKENKADLKGFEGRQFISFHPSFSYYAREYGLVQYSLEPGGKEPTPQRMARLIDLARREDISVIYIQSDFDLEQARVFAEEIDGKIEQLTPLSPDWSDNLRDITRKLVSNFSN